MKCLLDWFGVTYWPNRLGPARRNTFFYELDEEEGAEDDGVEDDDEPEEEDAEGDEVELESLFVAEELESPLFPSPFDSELAPSFFPPAESLGFDAFGSFNLFE